MNANNYSFLNKVAFGIITIALFVLFQMISSNILSLGRLTLYFLWIFIMLIFLNNYIIHKNKGAYSNSIISVHILNPLVLAVAVIFNFSATILLTTLFLFGEFIIGSQLSFADVFSPNNILGTLKFAVFVTLIAFVSYTVIISRITHQKLLNKQKALTGTVSAQFESLKNQLDPHFLFNSLNVLHALIDENQDKAQEFTQGLSKTYRYILEQKNKELVPLETELAFAKSYMQLLQMRFEDGLEVHFSEHLKFSHGNIVPLSLQLLLENVIKHNKITSNRPVEINIYQEDGYLIVSNNLNKKQHRETSNGIGLNNIQSRYALLTNRQIHVIETTDTFTIKLPLLTKKQTTMEIIENQNEILLAKAKLKVEKIKKFYANLTTFIAVNLFLMVINIMTSPGFLWFLIPLFAMAIGIAREAMKVYDYNLFLGKNWEDRKLEEFINKENKKTNKWQ